MLTTLILTFLLPLTHAETCADDFGDALHAHQRAAVTKARDNGFTLRVFTKTIAGVVRTVVLAARPEVATPRALLANWTLKTAFPELGTLRKLDNFRPVRFFERHQVAAEDARTRAAERKLFEHMKDRFAAGTLSMEHALSWLKAQKEKEPDSVVYDHVAELLSGASKLPPLPAEQLTFELEHDYQPALAVQVATFSQSLAKQVALLNRNVFAYVAGALIGSGALVALTQDPRAWWVAGAGAGLLALRVGAHYLARYPSPGAVILRERNELVARNLDRLFAEDADVTELLTLGEGVRLASLARALGAAGYTERPTAAATTAAVNTGK